MKLIAALFDSASDAKAAHSDLVTAGYESKQIVSVDSGTSATDAQSRLTSAGIPQRDAQLYGEGVRRGGSVLTLKVDDAKAQEVIEIMDRHDAADMDERMRTWRSEGWTAGGSAEGAEEGTIEVVEEQMRVGKRETETGGVRVRSRIVEEPVEEQVTLKEEHVHVERHPVDRPADAGALSSAQEGTIEVTETSEEAVVDKTARVVEEIEVSKDSDVRTETVSDTVRHTEVDVDEVAGKNRKS